MKKLWMLTILTAVTVGSTGCMCNGPLMRWAQSHNAWLCGGSGYGGGYQQCAPVCCEQAVSSNCCQPAASANCCQPTVSNYAPAATATVVAPATVAPASGTTYVP